MVDPDLTEIKQALTAIVDKQTGILSQQSAMAGQLDRQGKQIDALIDLRAESIKLLTIVAQIKEDTKENKGAWNSAFIEIRKLQNHQLQCTFELECETVREKITANAKKANEDLEGVVKKRIKPIEVSVRWAWGVLVLFLLGIMSKSIWS